MKKIIIIILSILLLAIAVTGVYFWFNQANLTINSDYDLVFNLQLSDQAKSPIITIKSNQKVRLAKGNYTFKLISDTYQTSVKNLEILKDTVLNPELDYKDDYEQNKFSDEIIKIRQLLSDSYQSKGFIVSDMVDFSQFGQYAIATITKYPDNPALIGEFDVFKIIFKANQQNWQQITEPSLVFYYNDYKNIPVSVLKAANQILDSF